VKANAANLPPEVKADTTPISVGRFISRTGSAQESESETGSEPPDVAMTPIFMSALPAEIDGRSMRYRTLEDVQTASNLLWNPVQMPTTTPGMLGDRMPCCSPTYTQV
jgi:hypothetical protein